MEREIRGSEWIMSSQLELLGPFCLYTITPASLGVMPTLIHDQAFFPISSEPTLLILPRNVFIHSKTLCSHYGSLLHPFNEVQGHNAFELNELLFPSSYPF